MKKIILKIIALTTIFASLSSVAFAEPIESNLDSSSQNVINTENVFLLGN